MVGTVRKNKPEFRVSISKNNVHRKQDLNKASLCYRYNKDFTHIEAMFSPQVKIISLLLKF